MPLKRRRWIRCPKRYSAHCYYLKRSCVAKPRRMSNRVITGIRPLGPSSPIWGLSAVVEPS